MRIVDGWGLRELCGGTYNRLTDRKEIVCMLQVISSETILATRCKRTYSNAHTYHINSIALSSDMETFISGGTETHADECVVFLENGQQQGGVEYEATAGHCCTVVPWVA